MDTVVLEANKTYLISWNGEPAFQASYLFEERGFHVFLCQGVKLPIRKQYLKIIKEIKNE